MHRFAEVLVVSDLKISIEIATRFREARLAMTIYFFHFLHFLHSRTSALTHFFTYFEWNSFTH